MDQPADDLLPLILGRVPKWKDLSLVSDKVNEVKRSKDSRTHVLTHEFLKVLPPQPIQFATYFRGCMYVVCAAVPSSSPTRVYYSVVGTNFLTQVPVILIFGTTRSYIRGRNCLLVYDMYTNKWEPPVFTPQAFGSSLNVTVRNRLYMLAASPPMWWDAGSYGPFPILNDGLGLCSCGSYFHFHLGKPFMAELNGRVAIIWVHKDDEEVEADFSKLCMCLISISVNGGFVRGTQEKVEVVDLVPRSYDIYKCIEVLSEPESTTATTSS
ncbi:hypothetical protein Bca4012_099964 [Brassica carinata]